MNAVVTIYGSSDDFIEIDGPCQGCDESVAPSLAAARLRNRLEAKLDDMTLWDDTGDPADDGYMAAVKELRSWLDNEA